MKTKYRTADNLAVYDLSPRSSVLLAIAGPDDLDESTIDIDEIPSGCRWVDEHEWSQLDSQQS